MALGPAWFCLIHPVSTRFRCSRARYTIDQWGINSRVAGGLVAGPLINCSMILRSRDALGSKSATGIPATGEKGAALGNRGHIFIIAFIIAATIWLTVTGSLAQTQGSLASDLHLELTDATPELVFDPAQNGCSANDIPDAAARAFRDADGLIHLVAAHYDDRQLIGPRFDALTHPCEQIFRSRADPDPAAYADRSWLTAFFTKDGRTVHSLVHHEYQGDAHSSPLCPSRQYLPCWENSVLTTLSTDGGNHFAAPIIPRDVLAVPPFRYIGEAARKPVGYFQPSNIIDQDGLYYVLIKAEDFAGQQRGNCLFRTADLAVPRGWKAWDGRSFTVTFSDPYREPIPIPPPTCIPVGMEAGFIPTVMSLVRDTLSKLYIVTIETGRSGGAIYYATSQDLISWNTPSLLWSAPVPWTHTCETETAVSYPSLIDHAATDGNFTTVAALPHLYLYYTEHEFAGCGARVSSRLFRRPLVLLRGPG